MLALLSAVISGVLFALSLPPYNLSLLAWICLVPVMVAAIGRRAIESMGLGLLAALSAGVVQAGIHGQGFGMFLAYYPFILCAPLFAVIVEVGSANRKRLTGVAWTSMVAAFGVTCEWLTRFLPMPIHLALSQYQAPYLIQIASITGVWGVSFLIWWSNAALADVILSRREGGKSIVTRPVVVGLVMVGVTMIFGVFSLRRPTSTEVLKVAAIQDYNGEGSMGGPAGGTPADREEMTQTAASTGARMVVWSEECLGSAFSPSGFVPRVTLRHRKPRPPMPDPTVALARKLGVYLVAGYTGSERPLPYNSAALIAPDGRVLGIHHKIKLYAEEKRLLRAGTTATVTSTDIGKVGMEICFDTCNTEVTRQETAAGARLIAVPTYDPPVVRGVMHSLHSALMPFRAVENGVPMVRDDSNGTSEVIDGHGRILDKGPVYSSAIVEASVPLGNGRGTLFTRVGDWFAYLCIGGFIVLVVLGRLAMSVSDRAVTVL
jgi:apolipoprotein N-acyltransferase